MNAILAQSTKYRIIYDESVNRYYVERKYINAMKEKFWATVNTSLQFDSFCPIFSKTDIVGFTIDDIRSFIYFSKFTLQLDKTLASVGCDKIEPPSIQESSEDVPF